MRKNGFTLVELLAVIAILAVIIVIFIPSALDVLNENETKIYKTKEKILVNAASDYVVSNRNFNLPTEITPNVYITSNTLVDNNYMTKILDTTSGNECIGFVRITVNSVSGYNYDPCIICENYTTENTFCTTTNYDSI